MQEVKPSYIKTTKCTIRKKYRIKSMQHYNLYGFDCHKPKRGWAKFILFFENLKNQVKVSEFIISASPGEEKITHYFEKPIEVYITLPKDSYLVVKGWTPFWKDMKPLVLYPLLVEIPYDYECLTH